MLRVLDLSQVSLALRYCYMNQTGRSPCVKEKLEFTINLQQINLQLRWFQLCYANKFRCWWAPNFCIIYPRLYKTECLYTFLKQPNEHRNLSQRLRSFDRGNSDTLMMQKQPLFDSKWGIFPLLCYSLGKRFVLTNNTPWTLLMKWWQTDKLLQWLYWQSRESTNKHKVFVCAKIDKWTQENMSSKVCRDSLATQ
jgi:hypothetical protein